MHELGSLAQAFIGSSSHLSALILELPVHELGSLAKALAELETLATCER